MTATSTARSLMSNDIERIGNAFYRVRDMERAVAFYRDVLGLRLKFRDGDDWAAFDVGGSTLALSATDQRGTAGAGATLSLKVADVDGWAREAAGRGGALPAPESGAHERTVTVTDPDGHRLIVYSSL
jgi:catechol 2,3-dioxygenase-like lactoylglutathione lyase family enzyme